MPDSRDDRPIYQSWQCPPQMTPESTRIGWLDESCQEGQNWLKSQRGWADQRKALDILSGTDPLPDQPRWRSALRTNRLKRNGREIVGTLAKLRPLWGYHSDNAGFKSEAEMFNNVTRAWYLESFADRAIHDALAWALATRRGWVRPVYRRAMYGTGKGDIVLLTYGAPSVLPVQLPSSNNWQEAYCLTVLDEQPVAMAHGMFPQFQSRLQPSSSRYWYANDGVTAAARANIPLIQRIFGRSRPSSDSNTLANLLVPVRYSYILDLSINTTDREIPMGEPGASWSYTVPYLGQLIPAGLDIKSGQQTYRKANENDARLYPYRRLIISSTDCVMYDGPGFDWHGMFPGISFGLDDWPWDPLGGSILTEGAPIQDAINTIARGNMNKLRAQYHPSFAYDQNAIAKAEAKRFDPYEPDARLGFDGNALDGMPFLPAMTPEALKVTPESLTMWEKLEQTLDSQQAINDLQTLAKLRTVGSMDDIEKILEANGPIIEDMSRSMEPPMRDLGVMVKYLIMQYYTTSRVMQYVGPDGVTPTVFDFDPASLIPSHIMGEDHSQPSPTPAASRARIFADNLRFFILPNSLHEITQMQMKLGLIQLRKAGIKISSQTIAESWNVPNYGKFEGSSEIEKWQSEQEMDLAFAARMKELAEAEGLAPTAPPGAPAPPGQPPPGAAAPGKAPEGRPPSGHAAPRLVAKEGGLRSTITESK